MVFILNEYRRRLGRNELAPDEAQLAVAGRLEQLSHQLSGYRPPRSEPRWRRLLGSANDRTAPRGVYLWGSVGRGKTMLMDIFHERAPVERKRRVHFHQFMQEVHRALHDIRQKQRSGHIWDDANPIAMVCEDIAAKAVLLCFDEFQVTDIADAMILGRLFEALLDHGVVIVATSNTKPSELYRDGLNRNAFLPFISILEARLDIVELTSPRDYRLDRVLGQSLYVSPLGPAAERHIDRLWRDLTVGAEERPRALQVSGRELKVSRAAGGVARFSFADLCERPLGPADYIAIAEAFHTVIIAGVPQLPPERYNEARRFTILIDTLYDRQVRLIVSAATAPEAIHDQTRSDFEFARTVSRLHEMCSADYWQGGPGTGRPAIGREAAATRLAARSYPGY